MARYVDGFVLPIPKNKLDSYRRMAKKASKVWMDNGALEYHEAVGDDMKIPFGIPMPELAKAKKNEIVIFAWIVYKSRAHRDKVNAKVMKAMQLADMDEKSIPFDCKRMSWGGFQVIVEG